MKMNFKMVAALALALAMIASALACNQNKEQAPVAPLDVAPADNEALVSSLLADIDGGLSSGLFSDASESFAEMAKEHAIQIVRGVVKSAEPASPEALAQKAVVEVNCVYKGRELKTINVFQLYDNQVKVGEEYLLFLSKQYPDEPDSLDFYTVGGDQGTLEIDRQSKMIVANCPLIADNDLKQWLIDNLADKKDDSVQIADYEIVLRGELDCD